MFIQKTVKVISAGLFLLSMLPASGEPYIMFDINHPIQALDIVARYLPKNPVILEAGAYDGSESLFMANKWPESILYTFEPVPSLYEKLVLKTRVCPRIHTYQLALSDKIGTAQFYLSTAPWVPGEVSQSSSLLEPKDHLVHAPDVHFNNIINVPTMTIDAWAQDQKVDHVDLLWLDMQGYELQAIKAAPNILKTVKAILTEVEFVEAYAGQPLYKEVREWLENQGFEMIAADVDLKNPYWFGDLLFVRKESKS